MSEESMPRHFPNQHVLGTGNSKMNCTAAVAVYKHSTVSISRMPWYLETLKHLIQKFHRSDPYGRQRLIQNNIRIKKNWCTECPLQIFKLCFHHPFYAKKISEKSNLKNIFQRFMRKHCNTRYFSWSNYWNDLLMFIYLTRRKRQLTIEVSTNKICNDD